MDPVSQAALGAAVPGSLARPERVRRTLLIGAVAGMAPDLDALIRSASDPLLFLEYHRQFTHSLIFIPLGALVCATLLHPFLRSRSTFLQTYLAAALGYGSHGLLDACTSYGTQLFWPFSDLRVAWNNVSVVDPLFTLPVVVLLAIAALRRRSRFALIALGWALAYLSVGVAQSERAEREAVRVIDRRGHEAIRLTVKPSFANLVVWKVVYEHDGRLYVDSVRTGWVTSHCSGASIAKFERDALPWLDLDSQQSRDIERFRWFSNDFLAQDKRHPHDIIDVRYAFLPHQIEALWGIRLDPAATLTQHAEYFAERSRSGEKSVQLWRMITNAACLAGQ